MFSNFYFFLKLNRFVFEWVKRTFQAHYLRTLAFDDNWSGKKRYIVRKSFYNNLPKAVWELVLLHLYSSSPCNKLGGYNPKLEESN